MRLIKKWALKNEATRSNVQRNLVEESCNGLWLFDSIECVSSYGKLTCLHGRIVYVGSSFVSSPEGTKNVVFHLPKRGS